jgi:hydroxyethylthiazole kinase-like uncharacterized protein yjeF
MMMSTPPEDVTPALLAEWGLPDPGGSKKSRGQVIVIGGSSRSPGAVMLSGEAALRVGAGRVGLAVPAGISAPLGAAMPEAGVYILPEEPDPLDAGLESALQAADAVLLGPGLADPDATKHALRTAASARIDRLVLDAFALGVLPGFDRSILPADLIINANEEEAALLLERELSEDRVLDTREIADRYCAVVHCYGVVASPDGRTWRVEPGGPGLGTAGSGDVLSGGITGFVALGMPSERAAVWGGWTHSRAGARLTDRGGIGFLARDLAAELTAVVHDHRTSDGATR